MNTNYHVTPKKGKWQVKQAGATKASRLFGTQKEAEIQAKIYCKNNGGGEVRIHRPNGQIRDSDTVESGNDPCPPKDKKF